MYIDEELALPDNLPKQLLEVIDRLNKLYEQDKDIEWVTKLLH